MKPTLFRVLVCFVMLGMSTVLFGQSYIFTNCGASGSMGPDQTQVDAAYLGTNLEDAVTINTQGIQEWIVPDTAVYTIQVLGAKGGGPNGGLGASMRGDFSLNADDTLKILVGQQGEYSEDARFDYSGGGGTFVTYIDDTPLIIAGGGGGAKNWDASCDGQITTSGANGQGTSSSDWGAGGADGQGGAHGNQTTDGGAGLLSNGSSGNPDPAPQAFVNGGQGGSNSWSVLPMYGGFGGGGSANRRSGTFYGAGGGGGYSGGGSSYGRNEEIYPIAGGGGSYNAGSNQKNSAGAHSGDGSVTICHAILFDVSPGISVCSGTMVTLSAASQNGGIITWDGDVEDGVAFEVTETTEFTCSSSDVNDCAGSITITVIDPAGIDPIPDVTDLDTLRAACEVVVSTFPTATKACSETITATTDDPMRFTELGIDTITWIYEDAYGHIVTQDQIVEVVIDEVAPTITCLADQTINLSLGESYYQVVGTELDPTAEDNCEIDSIVNDFNNSESLAGAELNPGTHTITWTVVDGIDSTATCSFNVTVNRANALESSLQEGISIYPNPTGGEITVDFAEVPVISLRITDMSGRLVAEKVQLETIETIDLSDAENGVYCISILTESGPINHLIVKE